MATTKRTFPRFGVTRFKNGQCMVQNIYPVGGKSSDSQSKILGVVDNIEIANQVYLDSYEQSEWTGAKR